jgi:hypothetical protein
LIAINDREAFGGFDPPIQGADVDNGVFRNDEVFFFFSILYFWSDLVEIKN